MFVQGPLGPPLRGLKKISDELEVVEDEEVVEVLEKEIVEELVEEVDVGGDIVGVFGWCNKW